MDPNLYILGLSDGATAADIKAAYRTLVKKYHPDRNPNDPTAADRFNQITQAYDAAMEADRKRRERPDTNATASDTSVTNLSVELTLGDNYRGKTVDYEGVNINISPGSVDGDVLRFDLPNGTRIRLHVRYLPTPGFVVTGRDLHTTMTVSREKIERGEHFRIPGHPSIMMPRVVFNEDHLAGHIALFKGWGLRNHSGPNGDLYVALKFEEEKKPEPQFEELWKKVTESLNKQEEKVQEVKEEEGSEGCGCIIILILIFWAINYWFPHLIP